MLVECIRMTSCRHHIIFKSVQDTSYLPFLLAEGHLHDLTVMYLNVCICHRACTL